ncbi:thiol:disulfide interchange protein DsbG [Aeromonas hydrophila]|uniref:thiol:disulfide interchange protein DsbG n=1 Tax=Aeromonas hydrophila TaxID=644 RepID=UPI00225A19CE|nr:thiol:disulfide interchange protein DsbG [Aeromonas hydrophila]MCX4117042.1 thiol:disulfide interchange protein DsbG [Aeromonas hydrophila]
MARKINIVALAITGFLSVNAIATEQGTPTPVENMLMKKGVVITNKFDSAVPGMKALIAQSANGQKQLFYTDPAGQYLIAGNVFDKDGNSLSEQDLSRVAMGSSTIESNQDALKVAFNAANSRAWIEDGKQGKIIYAIFDPVCPYCHELYINTRQAVAAGKVQIRWLPVAILGDRKRSWQLIETLYSASDKEEVMRKMAYKQLTETERASDETVNDLSKNLLLLNDIKSRRVPTVMFKDSSGNVKVFDGLNDSRMQELLSAESL